MAKNMMVNICGVPHKITVTEDKFDLDTHFGMINHVTAEILVNDKLKGKNREETICHEMVHGMLLHLGYSELCNDETFVQGLGNAIMQGFSIKEIKSDESIIEAKAEICDQYCKYKDKAENEGLMEELCELCPLNKL